MDPGLLGLGWQHGDIRVVCVRASILAEVKLERLYL